MKIGVRAHDLKSSDTDEIIAICKQYEIDGLQLVIKKTFPNQFMDDEFLSEQIRKFRLSSIDIFLLGSYFNMIHPDSCKLEDGINAFKRNVKIAKDNNISVVGSETGSVNGDDWTYNKLNHTVKSRYKLSETITEVMSDLEKVNFSLEPVYDHVVYDHNITEEIVGLHDMSLTFDLANILNAKNYKQYEQIFEIYLQKFGDRIKLFHFKNFNIVDGKKVACELNQGIIDYGKVIQLIKDYKLSAVPVIVEELEDDQLFNSINYLRRLDASNKEVEK